ATAEDGAQAAWAGQLESYLNTTQKTLLENVQKCWASLFTPRAIFYRFEKKLHNQEISVAVVIQKMIQSEISGIAFSVHPVTEDYSQLIIEAGLGLGEAIVSGSITPDAYVVSKKPKKIKDINISEQANGLFKKADGGNAWQDISRKEGKKQKLSKKQILELSDLIIKIENHYQFPVDIEWAYENRQFYIVQSRPITTLTRGEKVKVDANNLFSIGGAEWFLAVTRNTPLWHQYLSIQGNYHNMKDFGIDCRLNILALVIDGTQCPMFFYRPNVDDVHKKIIISACQRGQIDKIEQQYLFYANDFLASLEACKSKLTCENWKKFQDNYQRFTAALYISTAIGLAGGELLELQLKKIGIEDSKIPATIATITYPEKHTPLFQSQIDLLTIGKSIQEKIISKKEIAKDLDQWLENYQHIPVNFCEEPWTQKEAKKQLQDMLAENCHEKLMAFQKSHRDRTRKKWKIVKEINNEKISILADVIARGTYLNEYRKNIFSKISFEYRGAFKEIARKGGSNNWRDVFYLTPEETISLLEGEKLSIRKIVKERKTIAIYTNLEGSRVVVDKKSTKDLVDYVQVVHGSCGSDKFNEQDMLEGFSANAGKVQGIVRVIISSKDFNKFKAGNILVAPMTSVDFVPLMEKAAAFVTNEGGITSHASIVAREMNKPCLIGTKIATQVLHDGDFVEVDANKGIVRILKRK
ncbi:MAG: PEP/pyruvate-binding domain-containing protein, partial [Candidatus Moraniibacteriota bacterium]